MVKVSLRVKILGKKKRKDNMVNKNFNNNNKARTGKDIRQLVDKANAQHKQGGQTFDFVGPVENELVEIWSSLLGHQNFGSNNEFFKVGGNSLKAVQLASRIARQFKIKIDLTDIFYKPSIAQLAEYISTAGKSTLQQQLLTLDVPKHLPLSFSQERIWFIDQLEGSMQYHLPIVLHFNGELNSDALCKAIRQVVQRHEALRTIFCSGHNTVYQKVIDADGWYLQVIDGQQFAASQNELDLFILQKINERFELAKDYMLRAVLIQISQTKSILVATMHHIASDGWSVMVMAREVEELYTAIVEDRPAALPELAIQYKDYALWQRNLLQQGQPEAKINYWKTKLSDVTPLQFPTDYARPAAQDTGGTTMRFTIEAPIVAGIQQLANSHGATLFMSLLAVFKILLHRYTSQTDICVGTPVAGRQYIDTEPLIGFFVNTLALRSIVSANTSFQHLLAQIKQTTIEAYGHQEVPFEKVVETVTKDRDMSRSPIFQSLFVLQNIPGDPDMKLPGVDVKGELRANETSKFDFSFYLTQTDEGINGFVEYSTALFSQATIERLVGHYKQLLVAVTGAPGQMIGLLPMLTSAEEDQLIHQFNNTAVTITQNNVVDAIAEQAKIKSSHVAVQFQEQQLSYQQLNEKANQLAHFLISKEVGKGSMVPICIERSAEMIVSILAVLKTGAAFVPVDPEYPIDRINYMLSDIGASIGISSGQSKQKLQQATGLEAILIDEHWPLIGTHSSTDCDIKIDGEALAYVIHTSGSTGLPKGVMVKHKSLINLLQSVTDLVGFNASSAFLSVTTFSFDICYLEFFVPLLNGGKLMVVVRDVAIDGFELKKAIAKYLPTHLQATPVTWQLLLDAGWKNAENITMLIGGEAVKEQIKNALTPLGNVYNMYGPTETTIWSIAGKLSVNAKVLVGKPLANTGVFILSAQNKLVPIGVAGQICIGGDGLAKGYLNRDDLTHQNFIANPVEGLQQSTIYKTGDLGKWMPDGSIECLGRMDEQVKIRGYRIEPGEIETVILASDQVSQAVVVAADDVTGTKKLTGYFIPEWQAIKNKEVDLYRQRVEGWREIYNKEYAEAEAVEDAEFDIGIWKDSFSGLPISNLQMKDWLQEIVSDILIQQPGNVLEIGCGTGLIYYRLSGKVNKYIGTDFSQVSIGGIKSHIAKATRNYGPTELKVCAAHEVLLSDDEKVDTIIMNCIVQYFPGQLYMDDVMDKCFSLLTHSGRIIIGDVRDNRLLESFKMRLLLQNAGQTLPLNEMLWSVQQEVLKEEELCFSPDYFFNLKNKYPQTAYVEVKWKNTDNINELSLYRYTVIIHVGTHAPVIKPVWQSWVAGTGTSIENRLQANEDIIAFKDVINFRLWQERLLNQAIHENTATTVENLLQASAVEGTENIEVKNIYSKALAKGYAVRLLVNQDPFKMDMVMVRQVSDSFIIEPRLTDTANKKETFSNIPLFANIAVLLQKELKGIIGASLPAYMIPSELVAIKQLPLTNNGKIDRRFLSLRTQKLTTSQLNYQAPHNDEEQQLVTIYQELLGIGRVGINDNFFELGGHSLLAMRLVSAIRTQMQAAVSIKALFNNPTVASLAKHLQGSDALALEPAIVPQQRPLFVPLSFSQERLWFIDKLLGTTQYHLTTVLKLTGSVNIPALKQAFRGVVQRHEILRTVIIDDHETTYQLVNQADNWKLDVMENRTFSGSNELKAFVQNITNTPFNLAKDYMVRASLIQLASNEYRLAVSVHHIAADGWSIAILVKELLYNYEALVNGKNLNWEPLPIQYADYAIWLRQNFKEEALTPMLEYWKESLNGVDPLNLPVDFKRPPVQSRRGALYSFHVEKEVTNKLNELSIQQGSTLFMTLFAAFNVMLQRYSNQTDICIGTPVANRGRREFEELIGFFINILAIRTNLESDPLFVDLLARVKSNMLDAYANQEVPFEKVVEVAAVERHTSRNPLFQVLFSMQNNPEPPAINVKDLKIETDKYEPVTSQLDMICNITEGAGGMRGDVEYCNDLFTEDTIARMMGHFSRLLAAVVASPQANISALHMLSGAEQKQLLDEFTGAQTKQKTTATISSLFEATVVKTPRAVAAVYGQSVINFEALNAKANQLASVLISLGATHDKLIGVMMDRSIEMLIAVLGILKSGAAYVPFDPKYPESRIQFILEDSGANIVITSEEHQSKIEIASGKVLVLNKEHSILYGQPDVNIEVGNSPNHLAYVIYTSGSTGRPKGVMIEHAAIVNYLVNNKTAYLSKNANSTGSFIHLSYTFDASLTAMFMPLINGKMVVISSAEGIGVFDDDNLVKYAPYDFIKITPAHLSLLQPKMEEGKTGLLTKKLVLGGEALLMGQVNQFAQSLPPIEMINEYGPTEAAVGCSVYSINTSSLNNSTDSISIGKAIDNAAMFIIGTNNELLPAGAIGEIAIAGAGLARGYLNNSDLTHQKFVTISFGGNSQRIYKTGDLARRLHDGNIEYLGRKDDQVKIRGYRVELGEIEKVLMSSGLLQQAVVLLKETGEGNKRLVAYVVPAEAYEKNELQAFVTGALPEYMVPVQWVEFDKFPLTSNGKIDRRALSQAGAAEPGNNSEFEVARNAFEEAMSEIVKKLLDIETVGIHDNFFDLGADSIISIQMVSRARKAGYELQIGDMFSHQTIARLSQLVESRVQEETPEGQVPVQSDTTAGLLPAQQWFFDKHFEDRSHFNQSLLLTINKRITTAAMQDALDKLVQRHQALRASFTKTHEGWQQVFGTSKVSVATADLQQVSNEKFANELTTICDQYQKSLDIQQGKLIQAVLINTPAAQAANRLFIVIHHLAVDGVSWRIIVDDLDHLLAGGELKPNNHHASLSNWYKGLADFGLQQAATQTPYWSKIVEQYEPLPTDFINKQSIKIKDTETLSVEFDAGQTRQLLQQVPSVFHTEINDNLLAALAKTLTAFTGDQKVVINMEGHGREQTDARIDISNNVGWFTSMYPVLLRVEPDENATDTVKNIKEQLRTIPGKGVGFGVLKYITKEAALQDKPTGDVVFNYLGQTDNVIHSLNGLGLSTENNDEVLSSEFPIDEKLALNSLIRNGKLIVEWRYSTLHFKKETIENLANTYFNNLSILIGDTLQQKALTGPLNTPSDFGLQKLMTYKELDAFTEQLVKEQSLNSIESIYRLSSLQQGMLFYGLLDGGSGYINHFWCDIINPDLHLFEQSWNEIMAAHTVLRSTFHHSAFAVPVQVVHKQMPLTVRITDLRNSSSTAQQQQLQQFEFDDRKAGFDFESGPLMRINLYRLSEHRYRMLWSSHHILFDGWSRAVLMAELLKVYEQLSNGDKPLLAIDKYEDYIHFVEGVSNNAAKEYWTNYVQPVEQSTLLPVITSGEDRNRGIGKYVSTHVKLNAHKLSAIENFTQKNRITVNTLMQGVWAYLLHHYTGNDKIAYGVIVSGRPAELRNVEQRVGLFINALPLVSSYSQNENVVAWLQSIQQQQINSRIYQYSSLREIQALAGIQGDLFDTLMVFENYPVNKLQGALSQKINIESINVQEQTNYPLSLVINNEGELTIDFRYNSSFLSAHDVQNICNHFEHVLTQFVQAASSTNLQQVELMTPEAKEKLLELGSGPQIHYPINKTLVQLFEEQVAKTPSQVVVTFQGTHLTYKQLNDRSNQLAHFLITKGVGKETLVPICLDRSLEMMIGLWGILKAGGAYVPIDPEYPKERINYILKDTSALLLLTDENTLSRLSFIEQVDVISIDGQQDVIGNQPANLPIVGLHIHNLAYIIYTSGSTGNPKGVMNQHDGVVDRLFWAENYFNFIETYTVLQKTTFCFDVSVWELFWPLLWGGKLCFAKPGGQKDVAYLKEVIAAEGITLIHFVPSMLDAFMAGVDVGEVLPLKKVLCSGEALTVGQVNTFANKLPGVELYNLYGPTEAAIDVTCWAADTTKPVDKVPIGKPIGNSFIYIMDRWGGLMPEGCVGEIAIGGLQVARGYLGKPGLTAEKFLTDPFNPAGKMYVSGDLGRFLPDGNIEYLGRIDDQVKIRGYRVEPGEIETVLNQHHSVAKATIVAKTDKTGNARLIAYVIPVAGFSREKIVAHLLAKLPDYMVPAQWVVVEDMPLTASGKINKRLLPEPDAEAAGNNYVPPANDLQERLVDIWKEILALEKIGIRDNFFEIGGHSISLMRLISSVKREFQTDLSIKIFFELLTIEELANFISLTRLKAEPQFKEFDSVTL